MVEREVPEWTKVLLVSRLVLFFWFGSCGGSAATKQKYTVNFGEKLVEKLGKAFKKNSTV